MSQLLRYFALIYFAGSALLFIALMSWQHFYAEQRMQWHLQQYAELMKVSLRPFIKQSSAEQLSSHLTELQFSALLPVAALAVYQPNGEQIARSGASQLLPDQLNHVLQRQYQLQHSYERLLAVQPLYTLYTQVDHFGAFQIPDAYLVVVPELPELWPGIRAPFAITWSLLTGLFVLLWLVLRRVERQRRYWLERLAAPQITQVKIDDVNVNDRELPAEFASIQQVFSECEQAQKQLHNQVQDLQLMLENSQQACEQAERLQQHYQDNATTMQQQIAVWLQRYQQLSLRHEQLSAPVFNSLQQLHLLQATLQFTAPSMHTVPLSCSDWLAQHLPLLNHLAPADLAIDWIEGSANTNFTVQMDESLLLAIMQAMLLLVLRAEQAQRLLFRVQLEKGKNPQLQLHISCDGSGLPVHFTRQLALGEQVEWQWRDADIAFLQSCENVLAADFKVQSLEGLGCSIRFALPVTVQPAHVNTNIKHMIVFDADSERLQERAPALSVQAMELTLCNSVMQLEQKLQESIPEVLLLFVPPQAPDATWLELLNRYQHQVSIQIFVPKLNVVAWQAVAPSSISADFCLHRLQTLSLPQLPKRAIKKLLVVDDNETNQAFIAVLLQHKRIELQAALTGSEVVALCQTQQFDMILLDISLPDISGIDVAIQLRRLAGYQQTPIFAFTAHALPAEINAFKAAGMNDIVLKPLDPSKFETLLARYQLY
ncbi:response regulator [Alishewanella tabrizica]|uniref:Response regulatory domain-containing protein n=1 Tax=Alishewanella tabrizica TaxID=671278 RepID=A0ABQ2WMW5_9ALTE|nr:response regulator [Alishewanella tabrizica]GGW64782.1 hypothetical protein GCM10008111_20880 [Alishewanella tabrizica]